MLRTTIAFTALFYATTAPAQADCKAIQDSTARLAYFDAAPKAPPLKKERGQVSGGNRVS